MFGIAAWKWLLAWLGLGAIAVLRIPVISPVAGVLELVPALVILLIVFRFLAVLLFSGWGSHGGTGTEQHDAILRRNGRL